MGKNHMVTRPAGRVSGIRGRVVLATAGIALGLGTTVAGLATQGAFSADSGSHLRLGDVGWNNANPHVVAGDAGDVGWNNPQPATTPAPTPSSSDDVGWN
ncbi:predicted protein [Streptomyces sp. C]|nr:predicted protein [Streptomyces sp. C]GLX23006.1 hypothetical protein Slala01_66500 [Streptomyces lavendulae subsp. lavendulae]GLX30468.1 hypothetical protein Slala02_62880 [Streptomyces lavendulae subsp. lavendulae]